MKGVNAIILAGGKNTRMQGMDKAFLEVDGRPMIAGIIDRLTPFVDQIIIVTNNPGKYVNFKARTVGDECPDKGPLMGIYSGLKASSSKYNFVAACDMPFLNERLIRYIKKNMDGYDIIIPKINKRAHPLFGIYSKDCIPVIEGMLKRDRLRISNIFPKVRTYFILKKEMERFDEKLLSLVNINTRYDFETAKETGGI